VGKRARKVPWSLALLAVLGIAAIVVAFSIMYPKAMRVAVAVGAVLIAMGIVAVWAGNLWDVVYPRLMVLRADQSTLRAHSLVRMSPDQHGFGGVVVDVDNQVAHDLDTGEGFRLGQPREPDQYRLEIAGRQRSVAALTGANIHRSVAPLMDETGQIPDVEIAGLGNAGPWLQLDQTSQADTEIIEV
jgi:hypothetical protein